MNGSAAEQAAEHKEIIDALFGFVDKAVEPIEQANAELLADDRRIYNDRGLMTPEYLAINRQVRELSAESGFYSLYGAEELGGGNLSASGIVAIQEAMHHRYGPDRIIVHESVIPSPFTNGLSPLLLKLNEDLLAEKIDAIRDGSATLCFALSEPDAGSDVFNVKSKATPVEDGWVINGQKQWISNAAHASHAFVFAVTDPEQFKARKGGITCFFVDTDSPGFSVDTGIPMMGNRGSNATIISLTDVHVTPRQIVGVEGEAFKLALGGIGRGRLTMSATCVGLARWALDKSISYANTRSTFGKTIGEHQLIQGKLAEMAMEIYLCKSAVLRTAEMVDAGEKSVKETSIVKARCTEMVGKVLDEAIQIHGGLGLTNEMGLESAYRFARMLRIPDGTSEIQRRTIAKRLLAGETVL
ncbi:MULTISPECIES: acyl-CoA dehydrogenase [unclassified Brevibacterium]|uniref:acyl-CoA dehydrogenase family protein n=1 Tax=unclassified Brevibacterium TaxID=2614124 RepID=UPI001E355FE8|nr:MULTISPECIES: acyl-CoA dehydrogenase [unclassified Brevibacterium]MCD1286076.1 acyl-CoA dehydrogenase [Brevibacterium sp. CCUG 69071]MDK8433428.1 acyl-CoA dehydrogenase [Brevibacterium sp. H-BE7]